MLRMPDLVTRLMRTVPTLAACGLLGSLLATGCGERRGPFNDEHAQADLAKAFERDPREVAIYNSQHGQTPDEWVVSFRLDGSSAPMEARFDGTSGEWRLHDLRPEPLGSASAAPWSEPSVLIASLRRETAGKAEDTMKTMQDLSQMVERYATANGHRYPVTDIAGLRQLLVSGGYTKTWHHDTDGWGKSLVYHAAADGETYLILSAGADGQFDRPIDQYFSASEAHEEAYGGVSSNPKRDLIFATGTFAQSFAPGG